MMMFESSFKSGKIIKFKGYKIRCRACGELRKHEAPNKKVFEDAIRRGGWTFTPRLGWACNHCS